LNFKILIKKAIYSFSENQEQNNFFITFFSQILLRNDIREFFCKSDNPSIRL